MPRRRRVYVPGASVHVILRGHNRGPAFWCTEDYERFIDLLKAAALLHCLSVHTFTLMTTHGHLLATPENEQALPNAMKACKEDYVDYVNRKYGWSGTRWNGRYTGIIVDSERYWLQCSRYIERNPVEAGIVSDPGEYRWSSYRTYAFGEPSTWLVTHRLYLALGPTPEIRQAVYRAICAGVIN